MKRRACLIILVFLLALTGCKRMEDVKTKTNNIDENTETSFRDETLLKNTMGNLTADNMETEETQAVSEKKTHPAEYYIKWAVPEGFVSIDDKRLERFNSKLEADGYEFGLHIVGVREDYARDGYQTALDEADWDICFTGMELNYDNTAVKAMNAGKYEDLTDYIENGQLKDLYPEIIWDTVRHNGRIYVLPVELANDGSYMALLARKGKIRNGEVLSFTEDNMFHLFDYIPKDNTLLYNLDDFKYVSIFGYDADHTRGLVMNAEGELINPLNDKKCLAFLRMLHDGYTKGMVIDGSDDSPGYEKRRDECSFVLKSGYLSIDDEFIELAKWKTQIYKRFIGTTAINVNSAKKKEAFTLLELLRVNHEYGNLLINGVESDPGTQKVTGWWINGSMMGLADGIYGIDDSFVHFSSSEERKKYYEKNVQASPFLYMDVPEECSLLFEIVEKYLGMHTGQSILFHDTFEEELEQFRQEYTEAFDRIMKDFK